MPVPPAPRRWPPARRSCQEPSSASQGRERKLRASAPSPSSAPTISPIGSSIVLGTPRGKASGRSWCMNGQRKTLCGASTPSSAAKASGQAKAPRRRTSSIASARARWTQAHAWRGRSGTTRMRSRRFSTRGICASTAGNHRSTRSTRMSRWSMTSRPIGSTSDPSPLGWCRRNAGSCRSGTTRSRVLWTSKKNYCSGA